MEINSDTYRKVLDNMGEYIQDKPSTVTKARRKPSTVTKARRKQARDSATQIGVSEAEHGQAMIDLQAMVRGEYGV